MQIRVHFHQLCLHKEKHPRLDLIFIFKKIFKKHLQEGINRWQHMKRLLIHSSNSNIISHALHTMQLDCLFGLFFSNVLFKQGIFISNFVIHSFVYFFLKMRSHPEYIRLEYKTSALIKGRLLSLQDL